jgi:DNA-binding MarR family transcriptional regulator
MAEEEFSITGLAPSYAFLLMIANEKSGIQPKEISEQMQLTASTVTRLIEKMEHKGFLERKILGKFTQVCPTEKSRALNGKIHEAWMNLNIRYSKLLGKEKSMALTSEVYGAAKVLNT